MKKTIELIALHAENTPADGQNHAQNTLKIGNDSDVTQMAQEVAYAELIELHFPAFTDGRAFSQAVQLRKRLGFQGDIRATGDVLIDQLLQMQRSGFSSAVLREDQSLAHGKKLLAHYGTFYQVDVANAPAFITGQFA
ncbi:MAG: DUF934 domain-containing protein [Brachymonas sp.]